MKKIYFLILIFLCLSLLQSCGYKPVYSSKNSKLKIVQIEYSKNTLNNQIIKIIRSFSNPKSLKSYNLKLETNKIKKVVSKNSKGDPQTYEIKISAKIVMFNDTNSFTKNFSEQTRYQDIENKFQLKQYEIQVEEQILDRIIESILLFLTDL
tara:strand:+ start:2314 stop:2769 length:456 start_codon:yes stop_codon:yes gene_type:complete